MTLWGGRFDEPTDAELRRLNDSLSFDKRLYRQDIAGSIAYARAIADAGVITLLEAETIVDGLFRIREELDNGTFEFRDTDEDIHTAIERRLIELLGEVGGKLHTGRSRNDQVATDLRLWVMEAIDRLDKLLEVLQNALLSQAKQHTQTLMPGYTHLQPAQPITVAHWLMSFFWMLARDRERLRDARLRSAVCPLGAGALAGNPFGIQREALARELGFVSASPNSLDAVSDRDFVAETLFCIALAAVHLSRLAEDVIIYSNPSFGFVVLSDRYSTGSSLMPQKRNADPLELARGKTGRVIGHLTALLSTLKGLPSSYNKDLQEDKESLFDAVDTLEQILPVVAGVISQLTFQPHKLRTALSDDMLATDLADYLVRKGVPFREAHHLVGQLVKRASQQNKTLSALSVEELRDVSSLFAEDALAVFDFDVSIARRDSLGGTAPAAVNAQITIAEDWLARFKR